MQKPLTFIFAGVSGAGKGTQLELLKKYISLKFPSQNQSSFIMGDIFRAFLKGDGYSQDLAREIINSGNLMPDFITNSFLVSKAISEIKKEDNIFVDGYPRSISQSKIFVELMNFFKRENIIIIDIKVSTDEVIKRMMGRGRADDTEESIKTRLAFYENEVVPAISYLKDQNYTYIQIDGEPDIDSIHKDILEKLQPYLN